MRLTNGANVTEKIWDTQIYFWGPLTGGCFYIEICITVVQKREGGGGYPKPDTGEGIFKMKYRLSDTVCSGPMGLLCLNLGGWVSLGVDF